MVTSTRRSTLASCALALSLAFGVISIGCAPGGADCASDPSACTVSGSTTGGSSTGSSGSAGATGSTGSTTSTSLDAGVTTSATGGSSTGSNDAGTTVSSGSGSTGSADAGSTTASGGGSGGGSGSTSTGSAGGSGSGSAGGSGSTTASGTTAAPSLLPVATTAQIPLTAQYDALNVPGIAAGGTYADPTTGVKIYKLTSGTFPATSASFNHDYSEGGNEVSLPYTADGKTRAVLVRDASQFYWLLDFTPGQGVSNPRQLTGAMKPFMDIAFSFSNNPSTPYYAYVSDGTKVRRIDIRTLTEADGAGWPVTDSMACWIQQSVNDGLFVWMRGSAGGSVAIYQPSTGTMKSYTNANLNEPRIDRGGRYVAMSLNVPTNGMEMFDFNTGSVTWSSPGDPGIPFEHCASQSGRWTCVDWNETYPGQFTIFQSATANSQYHLQGAANGTLVHGSGNWIQSPADPDDQWALFDSYDYERPVPTTVAWLAPGGMVFVNANGGRALLGHEYNTTQDYTMQGFAKPSSDGKYVLFTSNMDGSSRSDVFLAEMPAQ